MSVGLWAMQAAVRRSGAGVAAAVQTAQRSASSFRDVYAKTVLGVMSDVRGHSLEGTVVRDPQGKTARDLKSFVPRPPTQQQQSSGHILVDVGLKFPISVNCARARLGRDREDIAVGDRVVVKLETPEITEHLLGNPKHTTIHLGKGEFERIVVGSILDGDEDEEEQAAQAAGPYQQQQQQQQQEPAQDPLSQLFGDAAEERRSSSAGTRAGLGDALGDNDQQEQKQQEPSNTATSSPSS